MMNIVGTLILQLIISIGGPYADILDFERMAADVNYGNQIRSLPENDAHFEMISNEISEDLLISARMGRLSSTEKLKLTMVLSLAAQYKENDYEKFDLDVVEIKEALLSLVQDPDPQVSYYAITAFAGLGVDGDAAKLYSAAAADAENFEKKAPALVSAFLIMCDPQRDAYLENIYESSDTPRTIAAAKHALERISEPDLVSRCQSRNQRMNHPTTR